jgi:hypothetical protein
MNRNSSGPPQGVLGAARAIRLYPDLERAISNWIGRHPEPKPSRSEAVRQLLAEALARK